MIIFVHSVRNAGREHQRDILINFLLECSEITRFPERDKLVRAKSALFLFFLGIGVDDTVFTFLLRHDVSFLWVISSF